MHGKDVIGVQELENFLLTVLVRSGFIKEPRRQSMILISQPFPEIGTRLLGGGGVDVGWSMDRTPTSLQDTRQQDSHSCFGFPSDRLPALRRKSPFGPSKAL